jgi:hypothetical protein
VDYQEDQARCPSSQEEEDAWRMSPYMHE